MTTTQTQLQAPATREHLPFLDGVRGMAALYVVICHLWLQQKLDFVKLGWNISPFWHHYLSPLTYQTDAVGVFIVLSGFCLMLPNVNRSARTGELRRFFERRAWRIIPTYWAALFVGLALVWIKHVLQSRHGVTGPDEWTNVSLGNKVAHVLLLHNIRPDWMISIDAPLWSVAIEWQIYFIFALCLLPIYRQRGISTTLLAAIILGIGPALLHLFDWSSPWYLTLFGFGMLGAVVTKGQTPTAERLRQVPWGRWAAFLLFVAYGVFGFGLHQHLMGCWKTLLVGGWAAATIFYLSLESRRRPKNPLVRFFETPFAIWLGAISYSLYLSHDLFIGHLWLLNRKFSSPIAYGAVFWILGTIGSLALAQGFYFIVERPSSLHRQRLR